MLQTNQDTQNGSRSCRFVIPLGLSFFEGITKGYKRGYKI